MAQQPNYNLNLKELSDVIYLKQSKHDITIAS